MRDIHEELRTLRELVEDLQRQLGSIVRDESDAGGVDTMRVRLPAGGIPADESRQCRYYRPTLGISDPDDTVEVFNRWPGLAGSADVDVDARADRSSREGEYQVVVWWC
jgi:hypothetical protein